MKKFISVKVEILFLEEEIVRTSGNLPWEEGTSGDIDGGDIGDF